MRRKRKTKDTGGRFTVEDRSSASLSALTAYAAVLAQTEGRDVFVREIGKPGHRVHCKYDANERVTTIHST